MRYKVEVGYLEFDFDDEEEAIGFARTARLRLSDVRESNQNSMVRVTMISDNNIKEDK